MSAFCSMGGRELMVSGREGVRFVVWEGGS